MAEKEYIEREAAKNAIFEYICGHTMSKFYSRDLFDASKKGAEGAMNELDYVPTADVVAVVRCRDCKYYSVTHCPITGHELSVCLQGVSQQWVGENHFCSYGERREQG